MFQIIKPGKPVKPTMLGQGFSLLEVLVTLIVLSVGLLGLAALQATTLQNNHSAYQRVQATLLASDMADRMRSNFNNEMLGGKYYHNPEATKKDGCRNTTGCTSEEMAQDDIYRWQNSCADLLPGGSCIVCIDKIPEVDDTPAEPECEANDITYQPGLSYAIKIWWYDDPKDKATLKRYVASFKP
jgi:type IV pilus assembly protein PilV